jgi:hypothetical protein
MTDERVALGLALVDRLLHVGLWVAFGLTFWWLA